MELRKLNTAEHAVTRKLWEDIFTEDTKDFLDYYYFLKTRENEIYVIEEDDDIRAMLQLNPYVLHIKDEKVPANYIIAVATDEKYRKKGFMRRLLCRAMQDMYDRNELLTFLMPAAEAIYTPYDFRFVYNQSISETEGLPGEMKGELVPATFSDANLMAEFYEKYFACRYQICTARDEKYYQTLLFEQQSEHGGIMLMKFRGELVGMFCYANEGQFMIREPLYLEGYKEEFEKAVFYLKNGQQTVEIYASDQTAGDTKEKPVIMFRILHLEKLLSLLKVKDGEIIDCSFAVMDSIILKNNRIWRLRNDPEDARKILARETEDSDGVMTIGAFTSFIFGYKSADEICEEEGVIVPEHLRSELRKIEPLDAIFINEVV